MITREPPKLRHRQYRITDDAGPETVAPRTIRYVASDETVDRYGDVIRASGWDLRNYERNGPLLFGHNSHDPAIGEVKAWVEGTRLLADATFWPEGTDDFTDKLWRITQAGGNKAVSVGFLPTKMPNEIKDPATNQWTGGFEFIAQELLELSVVPVPANPAALAIARGLGLSAETQRRLFAVDERAVARIAAERRARTITLARLRPGRFGGVSP
jgi:hypothetical protein